MKQLKHIVERIVENRPAPIDWKAGFKDPDDKDSYQDTPLRLMRGETPFQVNGEWYVYVYDERDKDLVVYDFSSDMIIPYEDFQRQTARVVKELRKPSWDALFSLLDG